MTKVRYVYIKRSIEVKRDRFITILSILISMFRTNNDATTLIPDQVFQFSKHTDRLMKCYLSRKYTLKHSVTRQDTQADSRKTRDEKTAGRPSARIAVSIRSMHQPSFQNNFKRAYQPVLVPRCAFLSFLPVVSRNREYPSRTFADCLLTRRQIAHFIFARRHGNMHRPVL